MKQLKFLLLLLLSSITSMNVYAANNNDRFTVNGIQYRVSNVNKHEVEFDATNLAGHVNIPATVKDSVNIIWTVAGIHWSPCPNMTSVALPNTIKWMHKSSFKESKLKTITLPASVIQIDDGVFRDCRLLEEIKVASENTSFYAENGVLYDKRNGTKRLLCYPGTKSDETYSIPEGVTSIATCSFMRASKLKTLKLPASLSKIEVSMDDVWDQWINPFVYSGSITTIDVASGNNTYKSVDGVVFTKDGKQLVIYPVAKTGDGGTTTYTVPAGVENIADAAFNTSTQVRQIKFPTTLNTIGKYTFFRCYALTSITIPPSVTSIGDAAFTGCTNLTALNVEAGNSVYSSFDGVLYNAAGTELLACPAGKSGEYTTKPTTKVIKESAFSFCAKINKVTISDQVEVIEGNAFLHATNLTSVIFQPTSSLKEIKSKTVFRQTKIERLDLPASLETIGNSALQDMPSLKEVTIATGSKLKTMGNFAFYLNPELTSFKFLGSCALQTIGGSAFAQAKKLQSFTFPKSVTSIGGSAFNGCESMTTATFDDNSVLETIGSAAFQNSGLESISIGKKVKTIAQSAFNSCHKLKTVNIPASTTNVDPRAFLFCSSLKAVNVDKANTTYSSVDGFFMNKSKEKLVIFPPGKASTYYTMLPPTLKELGAYSFYYIRNLENVTIPKLVMKIGEHAFDMCKKLDAIAFLGEEPIPAANVDETAFYAPNIDKTKIDICVREDAYNKYKTHPLWKQFGVITKSFKVNTDGNGNVEYFPLSRKAVSLVDVQSDVFTLLVPKRVKNGATDYAVKLIADYAFDTSQTNVNEVVVKADVDYIGIKAFQKKNGTTTVKNVFFIGKTPAVDLSSVKWELPVGNEEFTTQKIYVKKSAEDAYKTAWSKYASKISYKIPDVNIAKKYGTFAREFDTDFSEYYKEKNDTKVAAFVAGSNILPGGGDYGTSTYHVKMWSIDEKGGASGNYGYVPAGTGVLLKVLDRESTPADFYYTIGEKDNVSYTVSDNIMHGVTVRSSRVEASAADPVYVMQGGVFRKATSPISNFPVHRAYMKTRALPAGAKIMLVFDETGGSTTSIEIITEGKAANADNVYYNLNGQRVENPQHGVYIRNGKKVIIK
ncbi:leucine-rich repeat domain-containing protein [Prevotella intermedia]|uniref:Leucine-rich repeat domain-containing protein n=1 Tax=Prevotella intermedia TaxID=28131 RepID=A0A3R7XJN0_PREIN|nr:leucine-rich repeat domain-containing protein [Prevotella intermedia]RQE00262.1 leucine-rich repeat domain-containing protein [Prevotella intermedia]RRF86305.1 leucine-rich repeat domain-containing protein [Prevotella intermedia]